MWSSLFKPVPAWDMDKARLYMHEHRSDEYNLVDVRQPQEFEESHVPGARLIPLGELAGRVDEIPRGRPTLVYCRSGGRAANGVAALLQAGLEDVHNIGGMMQWAGASATGAPTAGMAVFDEARGPEEYVALSWSFEENARAAYLDLAELFPDKRTMFEKMAAGEEEHARILVEHHQKISEGTGGPTAPDGEAGDLMEGGVSRKATLAWVRDRSVVDVLELLVTMEANAHDRYIRIGQKLGGDTEQLFVRLAEAEKLHRDGLMRAFLGELRVAVK